MTDHFPRLDENLLYDKAFEEIIEAMGDVLAARGWHKMAMPAKIAVDPNDLINLMVMAWLRGQSWAREQCDCEKCRTCFGAANGTLEG